jgi:thioredoxin-related protein
MRRARFISGCTALITLLLICATAAWSQEIQWSRSLSDTMTRARSTNKLVMIELYTDSCVWCRKLEKETFRNKEVVSLTKDLLAVKLNAEKEGGPTTQIYGIEAFPAILVLNRNGRIVGRQDGYVPPKEFARFLRGLYADQKRAQK